MSFTCITTFLEIRRGASGSTLPGVLGRYQNSNTTRSLSLGGSSFQYLSFIYQGAAKNSVGDNIESALTLSANQISMTAARIAFTDRAQVEVTTCVMNSSFTAIQRQLSVENWLVTSMSYDTQTIEVLLSSAIDAVGAEAPNRVLTRDLVGDLPVSGNIVSR